MILDAAEPAICLIVHCVKYRNFQFEILWNRPKFYGNCAFPREISVFYAVTVNGWWHIESIMEMTKLLKVNCRCYSTLLSFLEFRTNITGSDPFHRRL